MSYSYRVKCNCGKVLNTNHGAICPSCKQPIYFPQGGQIFLYRKGNFIGAAGGLGIYINEVPMGHIGNRETLCFPLPFGTYRFHIAAGINRKCEDLYVTITPQAPVAYTKVWLKPGFFTNSFVMEPSTPDQMPL